jgi:hypothetical protein
MISLKVRSTASKQCLCIIGASSHMMSFALQINCARGLLGFMVQVENSSTMNGMQNLE